MVAATLPNQEPSLNEMWNEAQQNFSSKTSKSLRRISLNDAVNAINKRLDTEETDEPSKKQKLKAVANDVLYLVNLLGGIAAQGASMVFGPANLCFNAMQILMNIPKMISKFYDDIQQLLSTVATFLKQFRIYQRIEEFRSLDHELLYSTHKLMITFIDICALSTEIFDGRKRTTAKLTAKLVLFGNDSGVEGYLNEFRQLVEHHARIENAITLEHVMKAEHDADGRHKEILEHLSEQAEATAEIKENVGYLYQQATTQSIKDQWQKHKAKIVEKLAIDRFQQERGKDNDQAQSEAFPEDPYKSFQQLLKNVVPCTGDWLEEISSFQQWMNTSIESNTTLLLSGEASTGKSCLAAAIVDKLKRTYPNLEASLKRPVSIVCYNFEQPIRVSREAVDRRASTLALKSAAFQIAEQNFKYAKALANQLDNRHVSFSRDLDPKALADVLLAPFTAAEQLDIKLYFVVDSLDRLSPEDRESFWDAIFYLKARKVRIVVTGDEEVLKNATITRSGSELIEINKHNENDLQTYITRKFNEEDAFKDQNSVLADAITKINKELPSIAKGNFGNVDYILDKVIAAFNDDEPADYIASLVDSETLNSKNQDVSTEMANLNNTLNDREIEQLNELLIWVLYAPDALTIEELNAALILHLHKATNQDLRKKIERKFSKVLKVTHHGPTEVVVIRDDAISNYFQDSSRTTTTFSGTKSSDEPIISMEISIKNAKLTHVRKFLWNLTEEAVLENLGTLTYADSALSASSKVTLTANRTDSNLALVRRCFDLLLDDVDEGAALLCRYAVNNLLFHLYNLTTDVSSGELSLSEREEVLKSLLDLLRSPDRIEQYFDGQFLWQRAWLEEERGIGTIMSWMSDYEAVGSLRRAEQTWMRNANEKNAAAALINIAIIVARQWLCSRKNYAEDAYTWLNDYVELTKRPAVFSSDGPLPPHLPPQVPPLSPSEGSVEDSSSTDGDEKQLDMSPKVRVKQGITRLVEWIKTNTNVDTETCMAYERIGQTYHWFDCFESSKDSFAKAEAAQGNSWRTFEGSARAYAGLEDYATAVEKMKIVIEQLQAIDSEKRSIEDDQALINNLEECARWELQLGRYQSAIEKLEKCIKLAPQDYRLYELLLRFYVDADMLQEAVNFLKELNSTKAEQGSQPSRLSAMILASSLWRESLSCLGYVIYVANHGEMLNDVVEIVQKLLAKAREEQDEPGITNLLLFSGILINQQRDGEDYRHKALSHWRECCEHGLNSEEYHPHHRALSAARRVFSYYIREIRTGSIEHDKIPEVTDYLKGLKEKLLEDSDYEQLMRYLLVSFLAVVEEHENARELAKVDMLSGLDLLSDDIDENDYLGYRTIGPSLLQMRRLTDALTAISLYGPTDRYGVATNRGLYCEGHERFSTTPSWSRGLWFCTFCFDVTLCDDCVERVKNGTLKSVICSPDHDWVRSPEWDDDYKEFGKEYTLVGGRIENGRRVDGQKMLIKDWLESLRKEWGYVKNPGTDEE